MSDFKTNKKNVNYERISYSINIQSIKAISAIAANKGKPESHIADKYLSEGISKDITTSPLDRYNAQMNCLDLLLSDIMECQNHPVEGSRTDKIVASALYELSFLGRLALSKRQKLALFSLNQLLTKLKEVDEDMYAEVEKRLKYHRKLCKFILTSEVPKPYYDDIYKDDVESCSEKDEQTDEEYFNSGNLRK